MPRISQILKTLLTIGLILIALWVLWLSRTILLYFIVALVITLISRPFFHFIRGIRFRQKSMPKSVAALVTLLLIVCVISAVFGLFFPLLIREAQVLYQLDYAQLRSSMAPFIDNVNAWLSNMGLEHAADTQRADAAEYVLQSLNLRNLPSLINNVFSVFGNVLIAVFSVVFMSFFLLRDDEMVGRILLSVTPRAREDSAKRIILNTRHILSRYFIGLIFQVAAITICVWIGLSLIGVKNALLIAFFTGLANLVPYLGPWIGASFGVIIMVTNNIGMSFGDVILPKFYLMLLVFAITQMLDNYIFQPLIFSNSIHAHPLEIFIVILIGGTLGGIPAMVAAIPTYAFIRIVAIELNRELGILDKIKNSKL